MCYQPAREDGLFADCLGPWTKTYGFAGMLGNHRTTEGLRKQGVQIFTFLLEVVVVAEGDLKWLK